VKYHLQVNPRIQKFEKIEKKFLAIFAPLEPAPRGARSMAWGWNIKKRFDDVTCFAVAVIHAKFHLIRLGGFL